MPNRKLVAVSSPLVEWTIVQTWVRARPLKKNVYFLTHVEYGVEFQFEPQSGKDRPTISLLSPCCRKTLRGTLMMGMRGSWIGTPPLLYCSGCNTVPPRFEALHQSAWSGEMGELQRRYSPPDKKPFLAWAEALVGPFEVNMLAFDLDMVFEQLVESNLPSHRR